ncbi:MAG TPA: hypothetical protein VFJ24_03160 [Gaiellales bacterium]|nr:hypothetical protein [Gaiellales bacterium]
MLLATRRGRLLVFDIDDIDAVAEHLAEVLSPAPANVGLVDAQELAEQLGVARDWVYANAERLGGVRLGDGPRARLRFDAERAREALTANARGDQPTNGGASRVAAEVPDVRLWPPCPSFREGQAGEYGRATCDAALRNIAL